MLSYSSNYQRTVIVNTSNSVIASFYNGYNGVIEYFSLKAANEELAKENAKLKSLLKFNFEVTDRDFYFHNDTMHLRKYKYSYAKVINNSTNKRNNYITINKGYLQNIKKDMAVITPNGVVGIINNVSAHYSTAVSILHKEMRVSSKIKKNNHFGSVVWEGMDYRTGTLKDIPSHVKLSKGDTIVTSGFSTIFPEGVPIGVVKDFKLDSGNNFYEIEIEFTNDMNSLNYVYIVENLFKIEQENLEAKSKE